MSELGTRGKTAETLIKKELKKLEASDTAHYRFPDARAGSFQVTPCDFFVLRRGQLTVLEVKEVKHLFRLPHANFSPDQLARMRMFQAAGAVARVAVYFSPSKLWRLAPADYFLTRTGGSWDMRDRAELKLVEVMEDLFDDGY